jgi:hypothetical protein
LYSAFYYRSFSSGYNPSVVFASYPPSRAANVFLLLVANLSLRAAPYCSLVL